MSFLFGQECDFTYNRFLVMHIVFAGSLGVGQHTLASPGEPFGSTSQSTKHAVAGRQNFTACFAGFRSRG